MLNVKTEVKGSILTIEIDLSKEFGPSKKTGKTIIIATTQGNQKILDDVTLGLNCYKSRKI